MVRTTALVAIVVSTALGGCEPSTPTQVLVIFEADDAVAARATRLRIDVFNEERQRQAWDINLVAGTTGATTFPVTLPLVPKNGDASRGFEVVAEVVDEAGEAFARQRVVSGYVDGELRELVLRFTAACTGVLCGFRTTCVDGACDDACADPARRGVPTVFHACDQPADGGVVPDAAPEDAGPAPDPTGCDDDHVARVFCDGFEDDVAARWARVRQTNGAVTRVSSPVYRGAASLEAQSIAEQAYVYVASDALDGATGDVWIRFYSFVPPGQDVTRLNLLYAGEDESPFGGVEVGLMNADRLFFTPRPDGNVVEVAAPAFPFGEWVCLEVHLFMDATDGSVELFLNGDSVGAAASVDTFPVAGFGTINAGLGLTASDQPPIAVYLDEVVADDERIGCDP